MAKSSKIKVGSLIQWSLSDSATAFGKVVEAKEDGNLSVETPSDLIVPLDSALATVMSEEEYNKSLAAVINTVGKHFTKASFSMDEIDTLKAEIETLKKSLEEANAKTEEAKNSADALAAEAKEAQDKLAEIERNALAQSRISELKEVDGLASVAESEDEAVKVLAEMSEATFGIIMRAARTNLQKLTEQTKTDLPKLTEQTQTDLTKLTEASLQDTKVDDEPDLATAATEEDETKKLMAQLGTLLLKKK